MILRLTAASRTGCVREHNEDMALIGDYFVRDGEQELDVVIETVDRCIVAVADGMGGHNCGEVASSDVIHNLHYYFNDIPVGLDIGGFNEAICEWLVSMNNTIDAKGRLEASYRGMGTTLVAFAYYGDSFYWMNCGDSRLYRLHSGVLEQLTTDHSLEALTGGTERSHVITNCIGGGCKNSYLDIVNCTSKVLPGDVLLLCSDGLTDMVADDEIARLLQDGADAPALCSAAEAHGGIDNVTTIVVRVN